MLLRTAALALAASFAIAPVALAEDSAPQAAPALVTAAEHQAALQTAPIASHDDASRYASREQQDKQAASYEGGSIVVVGISGGALIVLLLLILILA
ncbi:MAG: hypothetical protein JWO36_6256 [Myxococcales bacterium]|nr:hypothetical protein [Myxococcales bacterium]